MVNDIFLYLKQWSVVVAVLFEQLLAYLIYEKFTFFYCIMCYCHCFSLFFTFSVRGLLCCDSRLGSFCYPEIGSSNILVCAAATDAYIMGISDWSHLLITRMFQGLFWKIQSLSVLVTRYIGNNINPYFLGRQKEIAGNIDI